MIHRISRLCAALCTMIVLGACSDDPNPVDPPPPPPPAVQYTLSVVTGPGVTVSAAPGQYASGTAVPYTVVALPGFGAPDVVVDSTARPATGTLTMDRDHVIIAGAPVAPAAIPGGDPVLAAARQVLTAADPVAAYQAYLGTVADLTARVSADSARRHVSGVGRVALDWVRDSAAIRRVGEALHGKVFVMGESALPGAASLSSRSVAAAAAGDAQVRTAYVFTNGISTSLGGADDGVIAMAQAARESGRRLTVLGTGTQPGPGSPRVVYLLNYNHSAWWFLSRNACAWKAATSIKDRGLAYLWRLFRMSSTEREVELGCTSTDDLFETILQLSRQLYDMPVNVPGDAVRLASLAQTWRGAGYNVVLTAHSQGTLMTTDALARLSPLRGSTGPSCVSFASIASPLFVPTPRADAAEGIVIAHETARDFVMLIPGPKAPPVSTDLARRMAAERPWWTRVPVASGVVEFTDGLRLHSLSDSYLASSESRGWIVGRIGSQYQRLAEGCGGYLGGRVLDGETMAGIPGAQVAVAGGSAPVATAAASGAFVSTRMEARPVDLVVSAPGYESVTLYGVEPLRLDTLTLAAIPLVKTDSVPGGISGSIRSNRTLAAIPGATVTLRRGINATTGEVVGTALSSSTGEYRIVGVRAGTYTLRVQASGFVSETRTGIVIGSRVLAGQDVQLSPDDLDLRIKLTWGAQPSDLDSHLTGPLAAGGRFHVYYGSRGALATSPFAALDVDDVTSYGPETITVTRQQNGVYRYSVHDYTNRNSTTASALAASGATVTVYVRGQIVATYAVPSGAGTVWTVFEMENGVLRRINQMGFGTSFDPASSAVQPGMVALPEKPVR